MKAVKLVLPMVLLFMISTIPVFAAQQDASVENGKILFNDPKLGTNGKTCNTCHRDGKGLENAAKRADLDEMVSSCIKASLKGKFFEANSVEVRSLSLYIKSMAEKKPEPMKKAPLGC